MSIDEAPAAKKVTAAPVEKKAEFNRLERKHLKILWGVYLVNYPNFNKEEKWLQPLQ
jgi:hypothetical protein